MLLDSVMLVDEDVHQKASEYATHLLYEEYDKALLTLSKYREGDVDWLVRNSLRRSSSSNFMSYVAQEIRRYIY